VPTANAFNRALIEAEVSADDDMADVSVYEA
jgi:hypothetical protein